MSKAAKKTLGTWAKGLLSAALGGAAMIIVDPHSIVNEPSHAGKLALTGAIIAVLGYLKQSPLPTSDEEEDTEVPETPSDAA